MTGARIKRLRRNLQEARLRLILADCPGADRLYSMKFAATKQVFHMSSNGRCIWFDPDWLERLTGAERAFMLAHQLEHIRLGHLQRPALFRGERFHLACDVVVNSHLLAEGWQLETFTHLGKLHHETFYPRMEGWLLTAEEAFRNTPFDPAALPENKRRGYRLDSDCFWERRGGPCAGETVVLSPADPDPEDLCLEPEAAKWNKKFKYESRGKTPQNFRMSDEEAEPIEIPDEPHKIGLPQPNGQSGEALEGLRLLRELTERDRRWSRDPGEQARGWEKMPVPARDWRRLLDSFLQEETCDYTFQPPDRRFQEMGLFLPDFSPEEQAARLVLFMVDTSGSVHSAELNRVYGEICGALEQFAGRLNGWVGFFDTRSYGPFPFADAAALEALCPQGGGGTELAAAFEPLNRFSQNERPASVVVFTDGRGDFPSESAAQGIPVLWLFTEQGVQAPWGKAAWLGGGNGNEQK